jgi:hypothetical protein
VDGTPRQDAAYRLRFGETSLDRSDAYQQFAAQCVELARHMKSPQDRSILLEMALLWSRLAVHAAKYSIPKEPLEPA